MFLMGGTYNERQHLEVTEGTIVQLDDLPFDFHGGRCDVFRETQILACAPSGKGQAISLRTSFKMNSSNILVYFRASTRLL